MINLLFTFTVAGLTCPPTRTNIITPFTPEDKKAFEEHAGRCLSTKNWPCLLTFEKKGEHWYLSSCGSLTQDKINQ